MDGGVLRRLETRRICPREGKRERETRSWGEKGRIR
jgi:hypothetical protein